MLLDTTGKAFTLVTVLTADWTPRCYLLPGEWSAATGAPCSSRLFASTQMDVLYMTLNRSNSLWDPPPSPPLLPLPPPPSSLSQERGRVSCAINLINLKSHNHRFFYFKGIWCRIYGDTRLNQQKINFARVSSNWQSRNVKWELDPFLAHGVF